jgi:hypothetical protein
MPLRILLAFLLCAAGRQALAQDSKPLPEIADKTNGLELRQGYFRIYLDEAENVVWLQIDRFDEEFLYIEWLSRGLGYNPIGLDRCATGRNARRAVPPPGPPRVIGGAKPALSGRLRRRR